MTRSVRAFQEPTGLHACAESVYMLHFTTSTVAGQHYQDPQRISSSSHPTVDALQQGRRQPPQINLKTTENAHPYMPGHVQCIVQV